MCAWRHSSRRGCSCSYSGRKRVVVKDLARQSVMDSSSLSLRRAAHSPAIFPAPATPRRSSASHSSSILSSILISLSASTTSRICSCVVRTASLAPLPLLLSCPSSPSGSRERERNRAALPLPLPVPVTPVRARSDESRASYLNPPSRRRRLASKSLRNLRREEWEQTCVSRVCLAVRARRRIGLVSDWDCRDEVGS